MLRKLLFPTMFLVWGCGGDNATGPTQSEILNIAGIWNFSDNISNSAVGISCNTAGTIQLNQAGSTFSGTIDITTGVCTDALGNVIDNTGTQAISGGQINGTQVSFDMPFCQLSGATSGSPPNRMSGAESCQLDIAGTTFVFGGTWVASR